MPLPLTGPSTTFDLVLANAVAIAGPVILNPLVGLGNRGSGFFSFQATLQGTGAVSASVAIEVSNDGIGWVSESDSIINLSGTGSATGVTTLAVPYKYARANITAISGTGANVTVTAAG